MTGYRFSIENPLENLHELLPLYRKHYAEMAERLQRDGFTAAPFNPAIDRYGAHYRAGSLANYVVRTEAGEAVGYCNMYVVPSMHTQEMIAQEDTIFVRADHRNGVGRKLVKAILADLEQRGVRRVHISPVTDLRVEKIWARMGFRTVAANMVYEFGRTG